MLKRLNSPQNLRLNFARITRRCAHKKSRLNGAREQAISTPKRALIPCRRNLSTRNSKQTVFNSFAPVVRACFRRASSRNPNKAPRPDPTDLSLPLNTLDGSASDHAMLKLSALKFELEIAGFDHERSSCLRRRAIRSQISLILQRRGRARWESLQTSGEHRVRVVLLRWSYTLWQHCSNARVSQRCQLNQISQALSASDLLQTRAPSPAINKTPQAMFS